MYKIDRILPIVILIAMTSCQKVLQQDTAVLSEQTQAIVDLFLRENNEWLADGNQIVIEGNMEDDKTCYFLNIYENDSSIFRPYGKYNGIVHYHGYDILLFGDSWNDVFWECDTICDVPDKNNPERNSLFYDPIEWNICVCCYDTIVNRLESNFSELSSLPNGEYHSILCDSLQKIINPK